jgi:hypothetical protein
VLVAIVVFLEVVMITCLIGAAVIPALDRRAPFGRARAKAGIPRATSSRSA